MSNLARAQEMADGGPIFTTKERARIAAFKIPGDKARGWKANGYYARKPTEDVKKWNADHSAKLAGLLRSESGGR